MNWEQCKDQIAKKKGYPDYDYAKANGGKLQVENLTNEAAELYADSVAREAWDRACEAYDDLLFYSNMERPLNKPPYQPN